MPERRTVLILGGTDAARRLAAVLAAHPRVEPITALAGRTADPARIEGRVRSGGFGGADGLARFLRAEAIAAVVDATHPFARTISTHAATAAAAAGVPLVRLERPPWQRQPGDHWIEVADTAAAAAALPAEPATVFLAIGRQDLAPFARRPDHRYILRMIDLPADPLPVAAAEVIRARGPFDAAEEAALLEGRGVDLVVSKNAGGPATYGKIAAARTLGLPVILIRRPALPPVPTVENVADAVAWVMGRVQS
jgi:precorrin-6A/cobalt-precorrin-6A reductase